MDIKQLGIQQILDDVSNGKLRIPAFQRGFVWDSDRVAYLMDSIYKKYPFGTLLLWRTSERLKHDRKLGPLTLPVLEASYPVEYVLDGQQRLTSIFCVFKLGLETDTSFPWKNIYFDLGASPDPKEQQFIALKESDVDTKKHFSLRVLFDSVAYRHALNNFNDDQKNIIDAMFRVFQQVQIPCHVHQTDDKAVIAIIFERINRQGVPLDTLQLLSAWTWSDDFQLQEQFKELSEELESFGFGEDEDEENLMLRCCAAIINGEASPESLLNSTGDEVRTNFPKLANGIKGAIDFLETNVNLHHLKAMPFQTVLVPLSVYFASDTDSEIVISNTHREKIIQWFWRTCISKRYSSGVLRNLKTDIDEILKIKNNKPSNLGDFNISLEKNYFIDNKFQMGTVNTKTFVLMLAQLKPKSLLSGQPLDLKDKRRLSNRTEFHHIYPKAFLASKSNLKYSENSLANFCFLSRSDNRTIGGQQPSKYLNLIPKAKQSTILKSSLINPVPFVKDNYENFITIRADELCVYAKRLMGDGKK